MKGSNIVILLIVLAVIGGFIYTASSIDGANPTLGTATRSSTPPVPRAPVTFTSDPAGALVMTGNIRVGRTPVIADLPVGNNRYHVVAEEPYDYNLYKSYDGSITVPAEGTAVSVWLERTTAAEQDEQRARIAAEAEAERVRLAEIQAAQERAAEARRVYYRVETNCRQGASVTYFNANGDITQHGNVGSGWWYYFEPRSGQYLSISAQNQCSSGYVTVKFTNSGQTLRENTSTGAYTIASISATW